MEGALLVSPFMSVPLRRTDIIGTNQKITFEHTATTTTNKRAVFVPVSMNEVKNTRKQILQVQCFIRKLRISYELLMAGILFSRYFSHRSILYSRVVPVRKIRSRTFVDS